MKLKIVIRRQYADDLADHFTTILRDKPEPAYRFLAVAEQSAARLAEMPLIGTKLDADSPRLQGVRSYPMPDRFRNYVIFYRPFEDRIELLAMLHGARDLAKTLERVIDRG